MGLYRNGKFFAIHSDHLGTPRLMTNEQNVPVWQWPNTAFGNNKPTGVLKATANPRAAMTNNPVLLRATAATEMNLRFPGQYADDEAGQFYNYFRSYLPNQGRYTQGDPIGLAGGLNRFGYVEGNPLSYTDSRGLATGTDIAVASSLIQNAVPGLYPQGAGNVQMMTGLSNIFGDPVQGRTNLFTGNISLRADLYGTSNQSVFSFVASDFIQTLAHEMGHRNLNPAVRLMSVPPNEFHGAIDSFAEAISRQVSSEFNRRMEQTCNR